jgi:hypothetical protein
MLSLDFLHIEEKKHVLVSNLRDSFLRIPELVMQSQIP